jgi:predicted GIY-YIG superfamily endonuclease
LALGDWLLARSDAFRYLLSKFSEHKSETISSFKKVKHENRILIERVKDHEEAIQRFEKVLKELKAKGVLVEEPVSRIIKRRK